MPCCGRRENNVTKPCFCGAYILMQTRSKPTDTEIISDGDIHDEKRAKVTQHCLVK